MLIYIAVFFLVTGFIGYSNEILKTEDPSFQTEITDIHQLDAANSYRAQGKELFTFRATDSNFNVIQGGYFDGELFYIAANQKNAEGQEQTRILVINKEGIFLRESHPLSLDHANNITYNKNMNRLIVSHCQSYNNHGNRYSFVNPETFEITEVGDKEWTFFSMAYSPERNMYASGRAAGKTLDIWDGNLNHIKSVSVECPDSMAQGVFCDESGIYCLRAAQKGFISEIRVHDWDCNLIYTIPILFEDHIEPESINIVDGTVYIISNDWERNCGVVHSLTFQCQPFGKMSPNS